MERVLEAEIKCLSYPTLAFHDLILSLESWRVRPASPAFPKGFCVQAPLQNIYLIPISEESQYR